MTTHRLGALVGCCVAIAAATSETQCRQVIEVTSAAELYAAVEADANRGAAVRIRAGTYALSRPLRLRPGMELAGGNRYQDLDGDGVSDRLSSGGWVAEGETILDARAMALVLSTARDCHPGGVTTENPEPAVVVGRGNRVRGITLKSPSAGAGIGFAGEARDETTVEIEDSVLEGGRRAAVIGNRGCQSKRFRSTLGFDRNIVIGSGVGVTLTNFVTDHDGVVEGPTIIATLKRNRFVGNDTGMAVTGGMQGTDGGVVVVTSIDNRFEDNNAGAMTIRAGASQPTSQAASSNRNAVRFVSTRDRFQRNGAPAVLLIASDRLAMGETAGGENHGNRLEAHFVDAAVEGASPGVLGIGGRYRGMDANARAGTGNTVTISVRTVSRLPVSIQTDENSPARTFRIDPPNRVEIRR